MTFFVNVHPLNAKNKKKSFSGSLHLSGSSLSNLDDCPGETRTEKSAFVTNALAAWVKEQGLAAAFKFEVTVDYVDGRSYRVSLAPH
jgi:hypothetical protein